MNLSDKTAGKPYYSCAAICELNAVGVTVETTALLACPPKVAMKLATKASRSAGATYTWVESYCGPTATSAVGCGAAFAAMAVPQITPAVRLSGAITARAKPNMRMKA
jgi:hypothetical protein